MFFLYEVALYLGSLLALPFYLVMGLTRGKYLASFRQRLGSDPDGGSQRDVWIQAVSVGEVMIARTIADQLRRAIPQLTFVITTTTDTGQELARKQFPDDPIRYFPFDFSFAVNRFLDRFRPRLYMTIETEIWPNAVRLSALRGVRVALANGRISDRSFPRYRRARFFLSRVLPLYDSLVVREQQDVDRLVAIGASRERIHVAGNLKFDFEPDRRPLEFAPELQRLAHGRPILVLGSTVEGEDELLVPGFGELIALGYFIVVAPRKPQRFGAVAALLDKAAIRFVRRSELDRSPAAEKDVLLLDSIGELARVYGEARCCFIGGSLVPLGGHNPIEAAAVGCPVSFGPYMQNFADIAAVFLSAGGGVEVGGASELIDFVRAMCEDRERERRSLMARTCVERNRGAAGRAADAIVELLS